MKYVGSKNRLAKHIAPIIQSYVDKQWCQAYYEPMCGGLNMMDKIRHDHKYASDIHPYLIALLKQVRDDCNILPVDFPEEEYKYVRDHKDEFPDWYVGLVGFCSFGGKWFGGYPRGFKSDGFTPRNIVNETIRNLKKQAPNLQGIKLRCCSFLEIKNISNCVIYCDPPYKNTLSYGTGDFPYNEFYEWCREMAKNNIVLVSEYNMPDDFTCIWSKPVKVSIDSKRGSNNNKDNRVEKLFVVADGLYNTKL